MTTFVQAPQSPGQPGTSIPPRRRPKTKNVTAIGKQPYDFQYVCTQITTTPENYQRASSAAIKSP